MKFLSNKKLRGQKKTNFKNTGKHINSCFLQKLKSIIGKGSF